MQSINITTSKKCVFFICFSLIFEFLEGQNGDSNKMSSDSESDGSRGNFSRFSMQCENITGNGSQMENSISRDATLDDTGDGSIIRLSKRNKNLPVIDSDSESSANESVEKHSDTELDDTFDQSIVRPTKRTIKRNQIESDDSSTENDNHGDEDGDESDASKENERTSITSINDSMVINQKRLLIHLLSQIFCICGMVLIICIQFINFSVKECDHSRNG